MSCLLREDGKEEQRKEEILGLAQLKIQTGENWICWIQISHNRMGRGFFFRTEIPDSILHRTFIAMNLSGSPHLRLFQHREQEKQLSF